MTQDFSSIACLCARISIAYRQVHKIYAASLRALGLSNEQVSILLALYKMGTVKQQELASRFALDRSSLSRNLRRLLEAEMVEAKKLDKKSVLLSLTPKGRQQTEKLLPHWQELQKKLSAELGAHTIREIDRLNEVLYSVHQSL